ncbi:uncharacterized protein LOC129251233 [Anastrepha obliqua]|uniref:uncharacterized protein LOC129251233 n=1 Tax=Anastrepha obliqua TaxID=95512 RepID=UPI0024097B40|nr:uncharacterized protein LOC129251233 [Anastrepha obliqua]
MDSIGHHSLRSKVTQLQHLHPDCKELDYLTVVALQGCKDETLLFGSCYMLHAPQIERRKLAEISARKKHALVVGTDANAHHTVWGSADKDDRGRCIRRNHCPKYKCRSFSLCK